MKKIRKLGEKLKRATDSPLLFKIRAFILHVLVMIVNIDLLPLLLGLKKIKTKSEMSQKFVAIFSMYRPIFWHGNIFEMQFSKALEKKGLLPIHLLCRGFLDVCDSQYYGSNKKNNPTLCQDCRLRNSLFYARNKAKTLNLDDYLDETLIEETLSEINTITSIKAAQAYCYEGLPLGKLVKLSVCRYWLRLTLYEEHLDSYKKFLRAAVKLHQTFSAVEKQLDFTNHLIFNGRYATYNIPLQHIKKQKKPFHTYEFSERERILYTKNDIAVMWNDIDHRFQKWSLENKNLEPNFEAELTHYLTMRKKIFVSGYVDMNKSIKISDIDIAVFTNIVWDSGAFERETIFESQFDWLNKIIEWGIRHTQYKIVIRVHPAETNVLYNKTSERMTDHITHTFPCLPKNIIVIPPTEVLNSYGLMQDAKVVLTYTSSIGLEAALAGKTVLSGAFTHYTRDHITINPQSQNEFFSSLLLELTQPSFTPNQELVKRYTYWFLKIYHRLNDVDLYKKPFHAFEDSWFLRVPKIEPLINNKEFDSLVDEFCEISCDELVNKD